MRQSEQVRGLVLKCTPFQERHRIVTLFTENRGKSSVLARNSIQSRRFGGTLEPFSLAQFVWTPPNDNHSLGSMQEAQIIHSFGSFGTKLRQLELFALASLLNEFAIRTLPENVPSHDLFKLHVNALILIEAFGKTEAPATELEMRNFIYLVLIQYLLKSLMAYGHSPQLNGCSKCLKNLENFSKEELSTFNPAHATWICSSCSPPKNRSQSLSIEALIAVENLKKVSIKRSYEVLIPSEEISKIYLAIEEMAVNHLVGLQKNPLQSLKMLNQLTGLESNLLLEKANQMQSSHLA